MRNIFLAVLFAINSSQVLGHAFWLEPSTFNPYEGDLVTFSLLVGEHFNGEQLVRHPQHLKTFQLFSVDEREPAIDILGRVGRSPAGYVKIPTTKSYIVSYVSHFSETSLSLEKFREYLKSEQLTNQASVPVESSGRKEVKELFARFTKTLLVDDNDKNKPIDRLIGNELELFCHESSLQIPESKPFPMRWQLFFQGKPLADRMVFLENKERGNIVESMATDKDGFVTLTVSNPGIYMVRTINIMPSENKISDWRSYWTSTSFEIKKKK